ncbi:MAG: FAD binding domain-containing protein [bacterium]|nr:FAD binding domain-containing protein [bacterium]MYB24549.1 xanthine dehydrogenase family protein subunit M [Acidimicrobiia bacterium]
MKPARFAYTAPDTIEGTLEALDRFGDEAKVLSGGQSLVPMMNFRLARPEVIVDIGRVGGLEQMSLTDGALSVGARVVHARLEAPAVTAPDGRSEPLGGVLGSLLPSVAHYVGHLPIRVRGTFGGSIAHADPAAEWCILARTLDAEIVALRRGSERVIAAADFFETVFTTALAPEELLAAVRLPILGDDWRTGFCEFSRRAGDFAVVAAMTAVRLDPVSGAIVEARIGVGGVAGVPARLPAAEATLRGEVPGADLHAAAAAAAAGEVDPVGDLHGSAAYRRDLVRAMVARALAQGAGESGS